MKRTFFLPLILTAAVSSFLFAAEPFDSSENLISSTSRIDWTKLEFVSEIHLDTQKAGIELPSGKKTATTLVSTQIPVLIKDPLLSINVSSTEQLGDLVLDGTITLEELTGLIDGGKKSPGVFQNGSFTLETFHTLDLSKLNPLLVKHHFPYRNPKPIEAVASRAYTGIIIDARGNLDVHGEFVKDNAEPCFFPKIWDEDMNLIYERNMAVPSVVNKKNLVSYDYRDDESFYQKRVGADPMRIKARQIYGEIRTDPVISREDALKILTVPENLELLRQGKVVILLDKEQVQKTVSAPEKTPEYYTILREIKQYVLENDDDDIPQIHETENGIQLLYDLKFVADEAVLLDSETQKVKNLADILKKINENGNFTILVEGHTADVNKPAGQMRLSIERTQTIINELVKEGLPRDIFSYRGYGGNEPVASNATPEGRALNRRVVITARPKATYIQQGGTQQNYIQRN